MRGARFPILLLALTLALAGCARRQAEPQYVMIDPATGRQVAVMPAPQQPVPQQQMQPPAQQSFAQAPRERGLFNQPAPAAPPQVYQPPQLIQVPRAPAAAAPVGAPYAVAPQGYGQGYAQGYASAGYEPPYTLDAGDKLRIVVFGQDGISNSYFVDAGGNVTLPLIGTVPARGHSTAQLSQTIAERLRHGYVRDPKVTVEVESYRPFFILGEVTNPGQYAYVPNMTVETAVAIAGGFGPRAAKSNVKLTRNLPGQQMRGDVPTNFALRPGDTIVVGERWF